MTRFECHKFYRCCFPEVLLCTAVNKHRNNRVVGSHGAAEGILRMKSF